ncbi:MAG: hypothetical protein QM775_13865 [Pirellulales bacterium]
MPSDKMAEDLAKAKADLKGAQGASFAALQKRVADLELLMMDAKVDASKYGYQPKTIPGMGDLKPYEVTPLEELIRWRLWARTGGGLMAELGSHQLDAAGIFCSAQRKDGKKARPLSVSAVGVRSIFANDREVDDHVHCNYEFPTPDYNAHDEALKQKKIVVSYSSINGNNWGGYGEVVMGTKGTIILETEQDYYLYPTAGTATFVDVVKRDSSVVLDTTSSAPPSAAAGEKALGRRRSGQPWLPRRDRTLGLVHREQPRCERHRSEDAPQVPSGSRHGRCHHRSDDEHRHSRRQTHRVQGLVV